MKMEPKAKPKRAEKACLNCVKKKQKCQGGIPCEGCLRKAIVCEFATNKNLKFKEYKFKDLKSTTNSQYVGKRRHESLSPKSHTADLNLQPSNNSDIEGNHVQNDNIEFTLGAFRKLNIITKSVPPDLKNWNHDSFGMIHLQSGPTWWINAYFLYVHATSPLFSFSFINQHYYDLPLHLLHSMFGYTQTMIHKLNPESNIDKYDFGKHHYAYCESMLSVIIAEGTPLSVATLYFMLSYCAMFDDHSPMQTYFKNAINMAVELGINEGRYQTWISARGTILELEINNYKAFSSTLWYLIYQLDFSWAVVQRKPFQISPDVPIVPYFPNEQLDSGVFYTTEYSSGIWSHLALLYRIARRITIHIRKFQDPVNSNYLLSEKELKKQLLCWFDQLPGWLNVIPTEEIFCSNPTIEPIIWIIGSLHCIYHTQIILANKLSFLKAVDEADSKAVQDCIQSARTIQNTIKIMAKHNPSFVNVFFYSFYGLLLAACVLCAKNEEDQWEELLELLQIPKRMIADMDHLMTPVFIETLRSPQGARILLKQLT